MTTISSSPVAGIRPRAKGAALVGAVALAVAAVANLIVLAVGRLAGADMLVIAAGRTEPVEAGVGIVLVNTLVPLVLGSIALAVASRWGRRGWNVVAWLGLALGVLTVFMPFTAEATTGTAVTLAIMHPVTGLVWFAAIRRSLASSPV